jgi:hypothetical protein
LPVEIVQSNGQVVEIRLICEKCGEIVLTQIIQESQLDLEKIRIIACQRCKDTASIQKDPFLPKARRGYFES